MQCKMEFHVVNKVLKKCGGCVLFFVHLLYSFISVGSENLLIIFEHLMRCFRTTPLSLSLKDEVKCYPKVPEHLAVIVEEDEISYHDCIKLILWSTSVGIPFISFYSFKNGINPSSLYEVLCKVHKHSLRNLKWGKTFHKSVKEMAKKDINGYTWTPCTEVNLFSAKTVQECFDNVMLRLLQEEISPESISVDTVDKTFNKEIPLPDPSFALICGKICSTFGFLPWQLRTTELLHITTHHNIEAEDFLSALRKYAHCEQRFGK